MKMVDALGHHSLQHDLFVVYLIKVKRVSLICFIAWSWWAKGLCCCCCYFIHFLLLWTFTNYWSVLYSLYSKINKMMHRFGQFASLWNLLEYIQWVFIQVLP